MEAGELKNKLRRKTMCFAIDKYGQLHEFDTRDLRKKIINLFGDKWILFNKRPTQKEIQKSLTALVAL
jgi:hypothetical protein